MADLEALPPDLERGFREARHYLQSRLYEPGPSYREWVEWLEQLPANRSGSDKTAALYASRNYLRRSRRIVRIR